MNCKSCQQPLNEGAKFCRYCGNPVEGLTLAVTTPSVADLTLRSKAGLSGKRLSIIIAVAAVAVGCAAGATYFALSKSGLAVSAPPKPALTPVAQKTDTVQQVIKQSLPSVVLLTVTTADGEDLGTGFVCDKDGDVLTNAHVVNGATSISVKGNDGNSYTGTIIGIDPVHDVALVRVPAMVSIKPLPLGDSKPVSLGDSVVAIGSPLGLKDTVTTGVISGLNRSFTIGQGDYHNMFQTSAPIAPGNSGGPLLRQDNGKVIGINTAATDTTGNIGFSIPIDQVKTLITSWSSSPESASQIQSIMNGISASGTSGTGSSGSPAAGTSTGGSNGTDGTTTSFTQSCIDTLTAFYNDVNNRDYLDAFNMLGQSWQGSTSYTTFANGYSTTVSTQMTNPVVVASTNDTAEVTCSLIAQTEDSGGGTTETVYHMDYQFGMENGEIRIEHGTVKIVS